MSSKHLGILDIAAESYHADSVGQQQPSLSSSIAALLCTQTPLHAWTAHPKLNPNYQRKHEDRFDVGTVAHTLLLEGKPLEEACVIVDADSWRTKDAKEAKEAARHNGQTPLLAKQVAEVEAMLAATRAQLDAVNADPGLFVNGKPEQTIIWEEGDVTCRALIDWLHDDHSALDDFKTTSASANPDGWTRRTMYGIGADVQAAFYLRGMRAITGKDAAFRYVVQETFPPYALSVISLGPDVLAVADAKIEYAIKLWRECLAADRWPAFPTEICVAELPVWIESQWLEKESREAA